MNRIVIAAGAACLSVMVCTVAWAQPRLPWGPTATEIPMLPEECRVYLKGGPAAESYMQQFTGLVGFTHYCAGMNFMNRARFSSLNKTEKRFNLQSAIGEFNYVLKRSDPNAKGLQQIREHKDVAERVLKLL